MSLHAKPSGGYTVGSTEWNENIAALWAFCRSQGYSEEAFAGMMGNAQHEGGMNPWRWQSDKVSLSSSSKGYGLFQYTPAYGYIYNYGKGLSYYAPNLSTSSVTSGAQATDGYAQILAITASGKYFGGGVRDTLVSKYVSGYSNYKTIAGFKTIDNVYNATVCWLGYFEMPGWWYRQTSLSNLDDRYSTASTVYQTITGTTPDAPDPDDPERPSPDVPVKPSTDRMIVMCGREMLRRQHILP